MGCYGITIETFKALLRCHIVVRNTEIKKHFDASFSHRVVGEFPACRQWQVFRGAWKELVEFVFPHRFFLKTKSYFLVFVGDEPARKKGLSGDLASSGRL